MRTSTIATSPAAGSVSTNTGGFAGFACLWILRTERSSGGTCQIRTLSTAVIFWKEWKASTQFMWA